MYWVTKIHLIRHMKLASTHAMHTIAWCLRENSTLSYMTIQDLSSESNKNFEVIMNLKRSPFAIQDKNARDLDNAKDYPTISDLMREQKVPHDDGNTVHHRRDLDSLG